MQNLNFLIYLEGNIIFSGDWVLGTPSGKFEKLHEYMNSLYRIQKMCDDEISTIDSDNQERLSICVGHSVGLEKEFIIMNAKEKIEYALTLYHILKYFIVLI